MADSLNIARFLSLGSPVEFAGLFIALLSLLLLGLLLVLGIR